MTLSFFRPDIINVPSSMPSGLSCEYLIITAGKFSIDASSVIVPLSETDGVRRTTLDDLAVLCANCHRLIHAQMRKSGSHVSIENLKGEFYSEVAL